VRDEEGEVEIVVIVRGLMQDGHIEFSELVLLQLFGDGADGGDLLDCEDCGFVEVLLEGSSDHLLLDVAVEQEELVELLSVCGPDCLE
jgi:hypothetical protein